MRACSTRCGGSGWNCARRWAEHPGRQGFAVDAGAMAGRRRRHKSGLAGVAGGVGVRAGRRRARPVDAAAASRRRHRAVADRAGRGRSAWAGRCGRKCHPDAGGAGCPRSAATSPDLDDPQRLRALFELVRDAREDACCWPTTTVPMAARSPRCARWRSPRGWAWTSASTAGRRPQRRRVPHPVQRRARRGGAGRGGGTRRVRRPVARHGLIECAQRIAVPTTAPVVPSATPAKPWRNGAGRTCSTRGGR